MTDSDSPSETIVQKACLRCGNPIIWVENGLRVVDNVIYAQDICHRKYQKLHGPSETLRGSLERKLNEVVAWTLADAIRMELGGQQDIESIESLVSTKADQILALILNKLPEKKVKYWGQTQVMPERDGWNDCLDTIRQILEGNK